MSPPAPTLLLLCLVIVISIVVKLPKLTSVRAGQCLRTVLPSQLETGYEKRKQRKAESVTVACTCTETAFLILAGKNWSISM